MNEREPIRVRVDLRNPGQFFACCGLFELADRLWPGVEAWFEDGEFAIAHPLCDTPEAELLQSIASLKVASSIDADSAQRIKSLKNKKKSERTEDDLRELERLAELEVSGRIELRGRVSLDLDWWTENPSGTKRFKTWAGRQSILDIATAMHTATKRLIDDSGRLVSLLSASLSNVGVPLYFDSSVGSQSSTNDVGFSLDALGASTGIHPFTEFLALIGLQRCRPSTAPDQLSSYLAWSEPIPISLAGCASSGALSIPAIGRYRFQLLFRTTYLKGFLPATQY
jgi:CRISPR-associated protein Csb3